MADDTQLAQATQPFSFHDFLERMKEPAAADLVRKIKNFIRVFEETTGNPDSDSQKVQDFLVSMESSFRQHPVWINAPPEHQAQAIEALEKYLMTKLHSKTFAESSLDRERDEILNQRMSALSFVRPEHLDIPEAYRNEEAWLLARRELLKMNNYKAPRDKLVCILNCCRVINNLLHVGAQNSTEAKGADDFLPILIYVVIHANLPQLASNLEYIQRYRMASRMVSESAYFFTQLYSAASFIETVNANSLTIDPDEFLARMVDAGIPDMEIEQPQRFVPKTENNAQGAADQGNEGATHNTTEWQIDLVPKEKPKDTPPAVDIFATQVSSGKGASMDGLSPPQPVAFPSVSELEQEGISHLMALESSGVLRTRHTFLYATAADLTLGDVQQLLEEYKKLVLHYEVLALAVTKRHALSMLEENKEELPIAGSPDDDLSALSAAARAAAAQYSQAPGGTESGEKKGGASAAVLKLLNPFTRVPKTLKASLSRLDPARQQTIQATGSPAAGPHATPAVQSVNYVDNLAAGGLMSLPPRAGTAAGTEGAHVAAAAAAVETPMETPVETPVDLLDYETQVTGGSVGLGDDGGLGDGTATHSQLVASEVVQEPMDIQSTTGTGDGVGLEEAITTAEPLLESAEGIRPVGEGTSSPIPDTGDDHHDAPNAIADLAEWSPSMDATNITSDGVLPGAVTGEDVSAQLVVDHPDELPGDLVCSSLLDVDVPLGQVSDVDGSLNAAVPGGSLLDAPVSLSADDLLGLGGATVQGGMSDA